MLVHEDLHTRLDAVIDEPKISTLTLIGQQVYPEVPRVSVIIPARNEAANLPYVFTRLPRDIHEVILVDGHSTDDTIEVAKTLYPDAIVIQQTGRGKGNALMSGFSACTGDIVVMLDADGSADAAEIPRFVAALTQGSDFVKGSRFASGGGSADITGVRRLGNWGLKSLVNVLYGAHYTDLCYGFNAFWRHCLPYMNVDCNGFEVETLINVRIAKANLTVHEVPSYEGHRVHGASNLNAVRDGLRVLRTIVLEKRRAAIARVSRDDESTLLGYGWDGMERRNNADRRGRMGLRYFQNAADRRVPRGRRACDRSVTSSMKPLPQQECYIGERPSIFHNLAHGS